jgi:hypothetical protein
MIVLITAKNYSFVLSGTLANPIPIVTMFRKPIQPLNKHNKSNPLNQTKINKSEINN